MNSFKSNKIFLDSETIAEQLRSTRQARNMKLTDVAGKLKINYKYLDALEKNQFERLPKGVYGKTFLKEYAQFLGLDHKEIMKIYDKEFIEDEKEKQERLFSIKAVKNLYILAVPKILRTAIIITAIAVCFIYLWFRLEKLSRPPSLNIIYPPENLVTLDKKINIVGGTEKETEIMVNGAQVLSDINGNFTKEVDLKNGINEITITAKKKFGREQTIKRQVMVKEEEYSL